MRTDFVFPEDNEEKLLEMSRILGYRQLCLVYPYHKKMDHEKLKEKISLLNKKTDQLVIYGILAGSKDIQKASKLTKLVFVDASQESDITMRNIIEKKNPFMVFNLEFQKKDFIHHKNSGLNQVTCSLMRKNKISLGFSFNLLLNSRYRHLIMGRMMQNIRFMRKFGFRSFTGSFAHHPEEMRSPEELKSLLVSIGMHPKEAEDSLNL